MKLVSSVYIRWKSFTDTAYAHLIFRWIRYTIIYVCIMCVFNSNLVYLNEEQQSDSYNKEITMCLGVIVMHK